MSVLGDRVSALCPFGDTNLLIKKTKTGVANWRRAAFDLAWTGRAARLCGHWRST